MFVSIRAFFSVNPQPFCQRSVAGVSSETVCLFLFPHPELPLLPPCSFWVISWPHLQKVPNTACQNPNENSRTFPSTSPDAMEVYIIHALKLLFLVCPSPSCLQGEVRTTSEPSLWHHRTVCRCVICVPQTQPHNPPPLFKFRKFLLSFNRISYAHSS